MSTPEDQILDSILGGKQPPSLPPMSAGGRERFRPEGNVRYDIAQVRKLLEDNGFNSLPITVFGQGARHNSEHFDHRNSMDVALSPSSPEGQKLAAFLRQNQIPFEAFTNTRPIRNRAGKVISTGEHYHIGFNSRSANQTWPVGTLLNALVGPETDAQDDNESNDNLNAGSGDDVLDRILGPQQAQGTIDATLPSSTASLEATSEPSKDADDLLLDSILGQREEGLARTPSVTSDVREDVDFSDMETPTAGVTVQPERHIEPSQMEQVQFKGGIISIPTDQVQVASQQGVMKSALKQIALHSGLDAQEAEEFASTHFQKMVTRNGARFISSRTGQPLDDNEWAQRRAGGRVNVRVDDIATPEIASDLRARQLKKPEVREFLDNVELLRESGPWGRSIRRGIIGAYAGVDATLAGMAQLATNPIGQTTGLTQALLERSDPELANWLNNVTPDNKIGKNLTDYLLERQQMHILASQQGAGMGEEGYGQAAARGITQGALELPLIAGTMALTKNPISGFALHGYLQPSDTRTGRFFAATKGAATGAAFKALEPLGIALNIPVQAGIGVGESYLMGERDTNELVATGVSQAALAFMQPRAKWKFRMMPARIQEALLHSPEFIELGLDHLGKIQRASEDVQFREQSGAQTSPEADSIAADGLEMLLLYEEVRSSPEEWRALSPRAQKAILRDIRNLKDTLDPDLVYRTRNTRERFKLRTENLARRLQKLTESIQPNTSTPEVQGEVSVLPSSSPEPEAPPSQLSSPVLADEFSDMSIEQIKGRIAALTEQHSELSRAMRDNGESLKRGVMAPALRAIVEDMQLEAKTRIEKVKERAEILNRVLEERMEIAPVAPSMSEPQRFTPAKLSDSGEIQVADSHAAANFLDNEIWLNQLGEAARRSKESGENDPLFERNGWRAEDGTFISMSEMQEAGGIEEAYQAKQEAGDYKLVALRHLRLGVEHQHEPTINAWRIEAERAGATKEEIVDATTTSSATFNSGVEPSFELIKEGAQKIYTLTKDYAQWATQMLLKFGAGVRDYLHDIWQSVSEGTKLPTFQEIAADPNSAYNRRVGERGVLNLGEEAPQRPVDDPMREGRDDSVSIPSDDFLNTDNLRRRGVRETTIAAIYRSQRRAIEARGGKQTITRDELLERARALGGQDFIKLIKSSPDQLSLDADLREAAETESIRIGDEISDLLKRQRETTDLDELDNINLALNNLNPQLEELRDLIYPTDSEAGRRLGARYWLAQRTLDPEFWGAYIRQRARARGVDVDSRQFKEAEQGIRVKAKEGQDKEQRLKTLKTELEPVLNPSVAEPEVGLEPREAIKDEVQTPSERPRASKRQIHKQARKQQQDVIELSEAREKVIEKRRRLQEAREAEGDPQKIKQRAQEREASLQGELDKVLRQINGQEDVTLTPEKIKELNEEAVSTRKMIAESKKYLAQLTHMMASERGLSESEQARVSAEDRIEKQAQDEITRLERQLSTISAQVRGELPLDLRQQGPRTFESDPRYLQVKQALDAERTKLSALKRKAKERTIQTSPWRLEELQQKELDLWQKRVEKLEKRSQITRQVYREYKVPSLYQQVNVGEGPLSVLDARIAQAEGRQRPIVKPHSPEIQAKIDEAKRLQDDIKLVRKTLGQRANAIDKRYPSETLTSVGRASWLTGLIGAAQDFTNTMGLKPAELASVYPASILDLIRASLLPSYKGARYVVAPELGEAVKAELNGTIRGLSQFWPSIRRGLTADELEKMDFPPEEIRVSTRSQTWNKFWNFASRYGLRIRGAIDNVSTQGYYDLHYLLLAKAQAVSEANAGKLPRAEIKSRTAELILQPSLTLEVDAMTDALRSEAIRQAKIRTFQNQNMLTEGYMTLSRTWRKYAAGRAANFVVAQELPFIKSVSNVTKVLMDYTILLPIHTPHFLGELGIEMYKEHQRAAVEDAMKFEGRLKARLTSQQWRDLEYKASRGLMVGSTFMALGYIFPQLFNPPAEDEREYEIEIQQGREPNSVHIPFTEQNISNQWVGLYGMMGAFGANLRMAHDKKALAIKEGRIFSQAPVIRGLNTIDRDITDLTNLRFGEFAGRQVSRYVPFAGLLSDIGRVTDSEQRDPRTKSQPFEIRNSVLSQPIAFGQQIESRLPLFRFDVPVRQPERSRIRFQERRLNSILEPPPWIKGTFNF